MSRLSFLWLSLLPWGTGETTISIDNPLSPPAWSLAQRALLQANAEAAHAVTDKYMDGRGWMLVTPNWGGMDGPDDIMETFRNWPLLYMLGGPESILQVYDKIWEGHLQQFTEAKEPLVEVAKDGMYYKEFHTSFDWEHIGEGMAPWFWYGLARSFEPQYLIRARRFAGFYMNEDPEAPNYDSEQKVIRSLFNGSRGPWMKVPTEAHWAGPPRPKHDPQPGRPHRTQRFGQQGYTVDLRGDHPLNLMTTNLAMTAYLLTHEDKYRQWILEYVDAWKERIAQNGGNIPSNIGLDGRIGGQWQGKWYGGVYGWNFRPRHDQFTNRTGPNPGHNMFIRGPRIAFGIALLLTGDQSYVDIMRRQFDNLYAAKKVENGLTLIPHKHGDDGWYGYTDNLYIPEQIDICLWSVKPSDLERVAEHDWIRYLEGSNPDYPMKALGKDLETIRAVVERVREDPNTPDTRGSAHIPRPVSLEALLNLTLGANYPGGSGNVLHAQVRYFDPVKRRPGLPEDVSALVEKIGAEGITLMLVNTNQVSARDVTVQTGAYAEHQCAWVRVGERTVTVDAPYFTIRLAPGAGDRIVLGMKRYVHQPTFAFPWDRGWMVKK